MRTPVRKCVAILVLAVVIGAAHAAGAAILTGSVRNESGTGVFNVDIDLIDQCSGDNIFLAGDHTAADGTFSLVVPNGTYDLHFMPPSTSALVAADRQELVVAGDATLGITTLHPGALVSGTVQTPSHGAAAGVDLKFVSLATGERVFLTKSVTSGTGQYAVRVPPGTYEVDYRPATGSGFTDALRPSLVVSAADVSGLLDVLGSGFTLTGTVQDKRNNKLKNLDIDVYDACTGQRIPTAHDNTDANGNYSITLPAGTYSIHYDPPHCKALEAVRSAGVIVDKSRGLGTEQLKDALLVSGVVTDHLGQPVADAKIKFFDATTPGSPRQPTTHDRTAANGAFDVYVPPGTYDLDFDPPPGVLELAGHLANVSVGGPGNLGTIQLAAGVAVSGHLSLPGGVPAAHVNVNAVRSADRLAQRLANDETDDAGNYAVVVAPGTYDFQYDPATCSGLAPAAQDSRTVAGATALPPLALVTALHLTGSVFDTHGLPAPNVDLDVYAAGGAAKLYTPGDQTAADGSYDVRLPAGTYDVKFVPSSLTRLRPAERAGTAVPANTALPLVSLADGWLVSGSVRDSLSLAPLPGVTVEFYLPGSASPVWTTHHLTALDGGYQVAIDPGTWDMRFTPPPGSSQAPSWRMGVPVAADLVVPDALLHAPVLDAGPLTGPASLALSAWPNPARRTVNLVIRGDGQAAEVTAWDLAGRRVATVWRGRAEGAVVARWDGTTDQGRVAGGVYYLRLRETSGATRTQRVVVLP
jgi:5-hydroxyisourate hydrolase-like protein (transthyretin family)